jgi:uncharacterized Zn-binding protein involved in type VI secretion
MPKAVRVGDLTAHGFPLQGSGSPDVFINGQKAWRAMPAGAGDGLDQASKDTKAIMDVMPNPAQAFAPPVVVPKAAKIEATMMKVAAQVESELKMCGPNGGVTAAFATLKATTITLTAAYTSGAAVPGAEPGARVAFTMGYQQALSAAMGAAVTAIAGPWDMHTCPQAMPAPHGAGLVIKGSPTVFINNLPAALSGGIVFEAAGGPVSISGGSPNVFIEQGGGKGGAQGGSAQPAKKAAAAAPARSSKGQPKGPAAEQQTADTESDKDKEPFSLRIQLDIDPNVASNHEDRFLLSSSDGSVNIGKGVADDVVQGDNSLDLLFENLDEALSYSLKVTTKDKEYFVFKDVPGTSLHTHDQGE